MSSERILGDMTRAYGTLSDKDVYFGNVNCQKLNGVPISVLKSEGNDNLTPTSFSELYHAAQDARTVEYEAEKNQVHDYNYGVRAMEKEKEGLPGISKSVFLKNSAIGSRQGAVFGNKVSVISGYTNTESEMNPFALTTNSVVTDTIKKRHDTDGEEPSDKKIKMMDGLAFAKDKKITFEENNTGKQTVITQGKIVTSEIGEPEIPLKMHASQMEIDSDIVLGNTNKIVTSQIEADDFGTLELKASHILLTANNVSFDPDSTEIVTGNFPQVISNLSDYEKISETVVGTYIKPEDKSDTTKSLCNAMWRLQMFYNILVVKICFDKLIDEEVYKKKMENNTTKELYVNFPSEFYTHFVDFFGKEDRDNYVASSELLLECDDYQDMHRKDMSVYFNPMKGAFLILKVFSQNLQDYWPMNFAKHDELNIGTVQFVLGVKAPRLKRNTRAAHHPHS